VLELELLSLEGELGDGGLLLFGNVEALKADLVAEASFEVSLHVGEGDMIVGSLGARQAGSDSAEVEVHDIAGVYGVSLGSIVSSEKTDGFEVGLDFI
jgi:hypothetical protein